MIAFLRSFFLLCLLCGANTSNPFREEKVTCNELGLSFMLPTGFTSLDSLQMDAMSKRGDKAVKETFDKETLLGWQPVCLNLQDSLKRLFSVTAITMKKAVEQDGTVDKFIDKAFNDGNNFIIQRFKSKVNIEIDEKEKAKQSEVTIAGFKVRKNAFTLISGSRLLFFSRYYFFQKNGKLFLLSFLGSPRASDNEAIVNAIESAKAI